MTIKAILLALETFLLILFLTPLPIICSGNIAGIIFCFALLVITANFNIFSSLLSKMWTHIAGKITLIFLSLIILAGIIYAAVLSVLMYKAMENEPDDPDVIVVLGCKVNGNKPSRMLRHRLDTAVESLTEYPDAICIVSGGQGSNESVSEASAMKNYMVEKGIDESRIIMEDKSTSTYENIKFTMKILDDLDKPYDMTLVTDGFHQYRASLIAKDLGVGKITAFSAHTEARYVVTYWVREWLGITHFYVFGN